MNFHSQNNEDIRALFGKFLDEDQAVEKAEDIYLAEQIIRENTAPKPDRLLITEIKNKTTDELARRNKFYFRRKIYRTLLSTAAAAAIVIAVIGIQVHDRQVQKPKIYTASIIPEVIWDSEDISADDAVLATLAAEIEEIQTEMAALRLGENGQNGSDELIELEMELIDIDSDFWKG